MGNVIRAISLTIHLFLHLPSCIEWAQLGHDRPILAAYQTDIYFIIIYVYLIYNGPTHSLDSHACHS